VADVVDPEQHDDVRDAGLCEHVAIEPGERGGAEQVIELRLGRVKDTIADDALVDHAEPPGCAAGLQARGQDAGPAQVGVGRRVGAVGDRIAERDDRGAAACGHVDPGHELPRRGLCGAAGRSRR
jgi:hypothetical protein